MVNMGKFDLTLSRRDGENMTATPTYDWHKKRATPDQALARIEPGMNIFLGSGAAEPRTLVKRLMASDALNLQDLTLIQILSFGDVISLEELRTNKYRLKTFFSGWVASEAITAGRVDLIPSRFSALPRLPTGSARWASPWMWGGRSWPRRRWSSGKSTLTFPAPTETPSYP
jgi:acyl-CoA hydrolase